MSLMITLLTAAVGGLFLASGVMKLSESRHSLAVKPPARGGRELARARLLGVVGSVQTIAALGVIVPLLLQRGLLLTSISALVLVLILAFGVLPASPHHDHYRVFLVMCAPAAFMAYIPAPDVLGFGSEAAEQS